MRSSDWSSDVCSSDLTAAPTERHAGEHRLVRFLAARQGRCRAVQEGPVRTREEHAGQAGKRVRRDELILYCCQPIPADVVADGWSACPRHLQGCRGGAIEEMLVRVAARLLLLFCRDAPDVAGLGPSPWPCAKPCTIHMFLDRKRVVEGKG